MRYEVLWKLRVLPLSLPETHPWVKKFAGALAEARAEEGAKTEKEDE